MINKTIIEMYLSGKSIPQVAECFPVSPSSVRKRLAEAGVLRSRADAVRLAGEQGRIPRCGNRRKRTDAERDHLRRLALARWENRASGVSKKPNGYIELTRGENKGRSMHRVVAEEHLGRSLSQKEHVHHRDGDRTNNSIDNLVVMSADEHARFHRLRDVGKRNRNNRGQFV